LIGWIPIVISGVVAALLLFTTQLAGDSRPPVALARVVETVIPFAAALHAALLFSPEDEPALEVTLAAPRPLAWTLLERWGLAMAGHGAVGLLGGLIGAQLSGEAMSVAMARWIAPMFFLAGAAMCVTLTTRQSAFSAGLMLLFWFGLSWAGDAMLVRWPFLWPAQVYLQPDYAFYWLNRALLCLIGILLVIFAARIVSDDERMLLGERAGRRGRSTPVEAQ